MAKKTAVKKRAKATAGRRKTSAKKAAKRPAAKKKARATPAKKTVRRRKTAAKKAIQRPAARKKRAVSRTRQGRVALPGPAQDLALEELRDRILIELAALAESDRAGARGYKMILVIKRTRTSPLSYKLVVERSG